MKRAVLLLLLCASCAERELGAAGFDLTAVRPATISARGGRVTVAGERFPEGAVVKVDGVEATLVEARRDELDVIVRPLLAGKADVAVEIADGRRADLPDALEVTPLALTFEVAPPYLVPPLGDVRAAGVIADDVVVGTSQAVHVLRALSGRLTVTSTAVLADVQDLEVADLDGDGAQDVLLCAGAGQTSAVLWGPALEPAALPLRGEVCKRACTADLDGDGDLDLVTLIDAGLRAYTNQGGRGFTIPEEAAAEVKLAYAATQPASWTTPAPPAGAIERVVLEVKGDGNGAHLRASRGAAVSRSATVSWVGWREIGLELPPEAGAVTLEASTDTATAGVISIRAIRGEARGALPLVLADLDPAKPAFAAPAGALDVSCRTGRVLVLAGDGALSVVHTGAEWHAETSRAAAGADARALLGFDPDADGDQDALVSVRGGRDRLLLDDGHDRFFDASATALPVDRADGTAALSYDLDRDRAPDLLLASDGQSDRLYRNRGDGRFEDATPGFSIQAGRTRALAVFDFDADGDPDVLSLGPAPILRVMVEP